VVYATGAETPRTLGIDGEDLPGSLAAMDFMAWANGFPGAPVPAGLDTSSGKAGRAVIIGNGNVGIDVARLLLSGPERLAGTAIAPAALEALRGSPVSEVVLVARRGPADAAFAPKEFLGLLQLPGLEIVIDGDPGVGGEIAEGGPLSAAAELRGVPVTDIDWTVPPPGSPRLVLRFHSSPVQASGDGRVETVRVSDRSTGFHDSTGFHNNTGFRDIPAGLLVRSIGSRGAEIPGVPFDEATGVFPNSGGRISPGSYVAGWAKRGPSGGIGANRACAAETVGALLDDAEAGLLAGPKGSARAFARRARSQSRSRKRSA
jgi:ferredoxin--NADP+ reductase